MNRRSVLSGAASLGAVVGLAALWRATTDDLASAQSDTRMDLLNLGLQSEYLLRSAYRQAVEDGELLNERDLEFIRVMLAESEASVEQLRDAIEQFGGQPIAETEMTYPPEAERDRQARLEVLLELENLTIQGWQGAVPLVMDPSTVTIAGPLGFMKARHAGALAFLLGAGADPFSSAIETGLPLPEVLERLEPYRGAAR